MTGKILGRGMVATAVALAAYGLVACGDDDGDEGPDCTTVTLTYANFGQQLITTKCLACHNTTPIDNTVRLDTLPNIKTHSREIIEHAVEREEPAMPYMQAALPAQDAENLETWLECGAPP